MNTPKGKKKEDKDSLNYRLRENAKQTTLAEDYVTATSPMLEKATQELKNAMIKKDEKEIFKAKEKWSAFYNAYEGTTAKMKRVVSDTERTSVINVLNEFDKKIETMSPAALKTRYDISTEEAAKLSETISYIEKNKNLYNLGIDLSGMPTEKDLTKFALAAFKNNDLSYDDYMAVMNTTDDKKLLEIMNAKDETPTIKMLAAAVFKIRIVAQTVDSDILLQKGKKEELAKELQPKGGFFDFIKPQNYGQGLLNKKGL